MSTLYTFLMPLLVVILLFMPLVPILRGITTPSGARRSIICNLCAFFGVAALMVLLPVGNLVAYAAESAGEAAVQAAELAAAAGPLGMSTGAGLAYLAAALAGGMSAIGAGIAVASAAPAAIGATSEDPKSFGKAIIFVVLGEGVAIYGLLIAILIINKL